MALTVMDGETCYDSDISENWSVIDVNVNEEPVIALEAFSLEENSQKTAPAGTQDVKKSEADERGVTSRAVTSDLMNLDSDVTSKSVPVEKSRNPLVDNSDSEGDRSCGEDSIEILDLDGSYSDEVIGIQNIKPLCKLKTLSVKENPSSDEDSNSCDETIENLNESFDSNLVRRKRKRQRKLSSCSSCSLNRYALSDCVPSNGDAMSLSAAAVDAGANEVNANEKRQSPFFNFSFDNKPFWTFVIALVAFIGVSNLMGVDYPAKPSDNLVETIKKLEMEKNALRTRLSHLNRACIRKEVVHEVEKKLHGNYEINYCTRDDKTEAVLRQKITSHEAIQVKSQANATDWVTRASSLPDEKQQNLHGETIADLHKVVNSISGRLNSLDKGKGDVRHLKEISNGLEKIYRKLSTSQNNLEGLYHKLIKLKNRLSKKLGRIFTEMNSADVKRKWDLRASFPTRESHRKAEKAIFHQTETKIKMENKFPQPEEYYVERKTSRDEEYKLDSNFKPAKTVGDTCHDTIPSPNEVRDKENNNENATSQTVANNTNSNKNGNRSDGNLKKMKKKQEKPRNGTRGFENIDANKKGKEKGLYKSGKNEKRMKREDKENKMTFIKEGRNPLNNTRTSKRQSSDKQDGGKGKKGNKTGRGERKLKNRTKMAADGKFGERKVLKGFAGNCSSSDAKGCSLNRGTWFFKLADGREASRRQQTVSDWQFSRAKARNELRNEYLTLNWQLKRAMAREQDRLRYLKKAQRDLDRGGSNDKKIFHNQFSNA